MDPLQAFQQAGYQVTTDTPPGTPPGNPPANPPGTPPANPPGQGADEVKLFDEPTLLKGFMGGKFQKLSDLETEFTSLAEKAQKADVNPFANDYVKGLNEAIKSGIDPKVYERVANIDPEKTPDREALVLHTMWKSKLSREDAETLIDADYKLGEGENDQDQEVKVARLRAKRDAVEAKSFLSQYKADQLTPPAEKRAEVQSKAWESAIPQVAANFQSLKIEGKSGTFEFPVSKEVLSNALKVLEGTVKSGLVEVLPDDLGMKAAHAIVQKEIMLSMVGDMLETLMDENKRKEAEFKHNPRQNAQPPAVTQTLTEQEQMANFFAAQRGIKLRT